MESGFDTTGAEKLCPKLPDRLWGPLSLLLPHLHLVPKLRMVELNLHSLLGPQSGALFR
jgi:hypothetical protein